MTEEFDYTVLADSILESAEGLAIHDFDASVNGHTTYYDRAQDLFPFIQNIVDLDKVDYILGGNPAISYMLLLKEVDAIDDIGSRYSGTLQGIPIIGVMALESLGKLILFAMKDSKDNFVIRMNNLRKLFD